MNEVHQTENSQNHTLIETFSAELTTPFLPPQYLAEYEKIVQGSAQQMFDMIIEQQKFNIEIKRSEIEFNQQNLQRAVNVDNANIAEQQRASKIKSLGQVYSFVLSIFLMLLSAWFAYLGYTGLASVPLALIIGVITVLFLQKRHAENN